MEMLNNNLPIDEIAKLIHNIKIGKIKGTHQITLQSIRIFKNIISTFQWKSAEDLMKLIRAQIRVFVGALPQACVTANIGRRILKLIREEYDDILQAGIQFGDDMQYNSLHKLVTQTSENDPVRDYSVHQEGLQEAILDHLKEIEMELETCSEDLAAQAPEQIHSSEIILTIGHSRSVEHFLKKAAKQRKFEVIVAECAPACNGHALAVELGKHKIETTVITDAAIFAMMSRVNKVIVGTQSVLANGGLRAACGTYTVALAAKYYSVPVLVLATTYKLSPIHLCNYEEDAFNLIGSTEGVIPYNSTLAKLTKAYSPIYDYVPPELVTLFISNVGGNAPSYIYRLLSELYHPDDYEL